MSEELQDKHKNQDDVVVDMPAIEAREETKNEEESPPNAGGAEMPQAQEAPR